MTAAAVAQVGEKLLQEFCFVHLDSVEAKFHLLLHMLHKLYALVNLQCCEDDPDALTHHEILLPGHLMAKYFKEKVEESLNDFVEHVRFRCLAVDKDSCQMFITWPLLQLLTALATDKILKISDSRFVASNLLLVQHMSFLHLSHDLVVASAGEA